MIRKLQGRYGEVFVISSNQCWLPGVYDSERAAKYAFRFPDSALYELQGKVNDAESDHERRVITFEMLQNLRQSMKASTSNAETMVSTAILL